jgi:hypothetical protein
MKKGLRLLPFFGVIFTGDLCSIIRFYRDWFEAWSTRLDLGCLGSCRYRSCLAKFGWPDLELREEPRHVLGPGV